MVNPLDVNPQTTSLLGMVVFALTVILVRLRAAKKPVSLKKIIIPPIGMSTGFLMFLFPAMRIPLLWALGAFLAGAVFFSYPLIRTSKFTYAGRDIFLQRSRAFVVILLALLAVRLFLHQYLEQHITMAQTGAVFFILAFGMILPWRTAMLVQFLNFRRIHPHAKR